MLGVGSTVIIAYKKHHTSRAFAHLVREIIFNSEFTDLWEELRGIYQEATVENSEQEAFQDAFYTVYTERDSSTKALASQG